MEWLDNVDEGRIYVEEVLKNQVDTEETGMSIDAENEQEVMDCEEEGIEIDQLYEHLLPGDHNELDFTPSTNWCKTI